MIVTPLNNARQAAWVAAQGDCTVTYAPNSTCSR